MHEDAGYVSWFVKTWGASQKESHREFLYYIEKYTERMEAKLGMEKSEPDIKTNDMAKKSQGVAPGAPTSSTDVPKPKSRKETAWMEEEEDDSEWDAVTSVLDIRAENANIQNRLSQMEVVMQQMMQALGQIQQQQMQAQSKE